MALEYYVEDCKELLLQIKVEEKVLRLKRRWLMNLPLSAKLRKKLNPLTDKTIPEMLLRKDDAYCSTIRSSIQKVLGASTCAKEEKVEDYVQAFYSNYILKNLSSLLDKMSEKGLHCFAELLTDGLVEFEKSRRKTKGIIKNHLPIFLNEQNCNFQTRMKQVLFLLNNHENFDENHNFFGSHAEYQVAAIRLWAELEDLPLQALRAIRRKLNGESGHIPELGSYKQEQRRYIVGHVKHLLMAMLSELREGGELPEPLVKALGVASLTIQLILGRPSVPEFQKFSPKLESLQYDIAKAIGLLSSGYKVGSSEIDLMFRKLPHLKSSEVKFSTKSMRLALNNMLMDFLYECNDMEIMPESLLEVVSYINTESHDSGRRGVLKDEVEEEVELLLSFSAQLKQIVWDQVPELEVDEDFANACMENFGESDDDEEGVPLLQTHALSSDDSKSSSESFGETVPSSSGFSAGSVDVIPLVHSPDSHLKSKLQSVHITERDIFEPYDFSLSSQPESEILEEKHIFNGQIHQLASIRMHEESQGCPLQLRINEGGPSVPHSPCRTTGHHDVKKEQTRYDSTRNVVLHPSCPTRDRGGLQHNSNGNKYLSVQKACDYTSMAMYHVIGSKLAEFAQVRNLQLSDDDLGYLHGHGSVLDGL